MDIIPCMHNTWPEIEPTACSWIPSWDLRANTRHPKACINFMLDPTHILLKNSSFDCSSLSVGNKLFRQAVYHRA
jgi:hypothetical protein